MFTDLVQHLRRMVATPERRVGVLAAVVVVLPPLLVTTWLPFLDLVAYAGLGAYPAKLSAGPFHFATFQLTYIVHSACSRVMTDLGLPVWAQVKAFYLLQAGVAFTIIWLCLSRFVAHPYVKALALAVGALAFCDGLFIWGGPLAFSLAATALAVATYLCIVEAGRPAVHASGRVALLAFLSVVCHPFALPFALVILGLRLVLSPGCRGRTATTMVGLLVLGWAIRNDSAERATLQDLLALVTLNPAEMGRRFIELFTVDAEILRQLFGTAPAGMAVFLGVLGVIRLAGFLTAPIVAWLARESPPLRFLMLFDAILAVLYLVSTNRSPVIPWWPQRILTFGSCFVYAAGVIGPLYLVTRWLRRGETAVAPRPVPGWAWAAPVVVLVALAWAQVPLLRHGRAIGESLARCRASLAKSGVSGAFVRVSDVDAIQPFYLRCVPFLLFSDAETIGCQIHVFTEWHDQLRHPMRLTENWFNVGRPRYLGRFFMEQGVVDVKLERAPGDTFPLAAGMWGATRLSEVQAEAAKREGQLGYDLIAAGARRDAVEHFQTALKIKPDFALPRYHLALALAQDGRVAEAIDQLGKAAGADPSFVDAHFARGVLLVSVGRRAEALEPFKAAQRLAPDNPEVHFYLGVLAAQDGAGLQAIEHFQAAIARNPRHLESHLNLAHWLSQTGRRAEAAKHLEIAVQLKPDDPRVREAAASFQRK